MLNLPGAVDALLKRQIETLPVHVNRASNMGHDCMRHLVYQRLNWQDALPHDVELERVFAEGRMHEQALLIQLALSGVAVSQQQCVIWFPDQQISGHVDGVVAVDGKACPIEIKTSHPAIWDQLFRHGAGVYEWEEVKEKFQRWPWTRKYPAQLQLYMLGKDSDIGMFLFKDKAKGRLAQVNVKLDYEYAESLLKKAETINTHVAGKAHPQRIAFDPQVCPNCTFRHLCLPNVEMEKPLLHVDDEWVAERLGIREANEEARANYQTAHKDLVDWAKAQTSTRWLIKDWMVEKSIDSRGACRLKVTKA